MQRIAPIVQILQLGRVFWQLNIRKIVNRFFTDIVFKAQALAQLQDVGHVHFLHLVGNILAFCGFTHAIPFNGFG